MHKAVDTMREESKKVFQFFIAQLFFFHISSILLIWMLYVREVAIVVSIVLLIFFVAFLINGGDIISGLYISDEAS